MIAVTGATGKLGRMIIDQLVGRIDAGQIIAVVRSPGKAANLVARGVVVRQGNYVDASSLQSAFAGASVLMFISSTDFANRAVQHNNVVAAAKQVGVPRVVYTSVANIDMDNPLNASHKRTEQIIIDSGMAWTFLRDNLYMDSYVVEVEIAMQTGAYRSPSGEAGAALVSRADIARTAAVVLTSEGHMGSAYDMTGPSVVTPAVFAEVASQLSGRLIRYEPITWDELLADYKARGMPDEYADLSVNLERMIATNEFADVSDDIARLTGEPAQDFASFVRHTLAQSDGRET